MVAQVTNQLRVVCLDEAMANVDPKTARLMQHNERLHAMCTI